MAVFKIPFANNNQRFNITLSGKPLLITCAWNEELPAWVISVQDGNTQESIISGVALVTGANLLSQFKYTGIKGSLVVYTKGNPSEIPTFESLGNDSNVYYLTEL